MSMTAEALREHRELQLLRASGVSLMARKPGRRRPKPVNRTYDQLSDWVIERHDKMDAIR